MINEQKKSLLNEVAQAMEYQFKNTETLHMQGTGLVLPIYGKEVTDMWLNLINQKIIEAHRNENDRWKVIAEEIVEKDGVYRAVNYLNKRYAEIKKGKF